MKTLIKLMVVVCAAFCCAAAGAIEVRETVFPLGEIPSTNPRIERVGETVTHIEVFGAFEEQEDGSVRTLVADTSCDMDALTAALWVKEAKAAVGTAKAAIYSKWKAYLVLAQMGVWPQVKAWLETNDLWDAFLIANEFSADEPHFVTGKAALQQALGLTDAQVAEILAKCVAD